MTNDEIVNLPYEEVVQAMRAGTTGGICYFSAQTRHLAERRLKRLRLSFGKQFLDGWTFKGHEEIDHPSHLTQPWYAVVRYRRLPRNVATVATV